MELKKLWAMLGINNNKHSEWEQKVYNLYIKKAFLDRFYGAPVSSITEIYNSHALLVLHSTVSSFCHRTKEFLSLLFFLGFILNPRTVESLDLIKSEVELRKY